MLLLFLLLCTNSATADVAGSNGGCGGFKRMFSFGDSITDAGNLATISPPDASFNRLPYGETFFGHPTGRFCDGRLIVDFLADDLGLPFLTPFLRAKSPEDFRQGANFAVAGATALSQDFFKQMGLNLTIIPPFSLDVQLEWFKSVLIDLGAKTILVPGIPPMGCIPRFLNLLPSKNHNDYDKLGCLKWLNDFSQYHNRALKQMLQRIHHDPTVTLIYADYYGAMLKIVRSPQNNGFTKESVLRACCGLYCDGTSHAAIDPMYGMDESNGKDCLWPQRQKMQTHMLQTLACTCRQVLEVDLAFTGLEGDANKNDEARNVYQVETRSKSRTPMTLLSCTKNSINPRTEEKRERPN
ncbi:hypothetical protein OsI_11693 [Oryza sativa Indica Group]|uniref:Uncharacterized protein n=1 Tax=Oryza sativa subsp. indica TaxID=39946 RepID=B8AQ62_ORYSI|nr:hypothetical protein OsI_11693 [Oryza sativa Indica Group]